MTLAGAGSGSGLLLCLIVDPFLAGEEGSALSAGQAGKENQFFTPKTWPASAVPHTHTHTLVSSS